VANRDEYGIEAINLSLGTEGCSDGLDATSLAVNHAHDQGLVVAVAAGNSGPGRCTIGSPGAAEDAVTVGAMADTGVGGFFQAYFSSRGRTADGRIKPDVSAPGWQISSAQRGTVNGYITMSGTSMATPFVAGLALLMRDVGPALTSSQVKQRLMDTAVDWGRGGDNAAPGSSGLDVDYGAGRVDAYAAIASAGASLDSPSRAPDHVLLEGSLSGSGDEVEFPIEVGHTCFPLAATLMHATGSGVNPDFDLVLERPDGTQADSSESLDRQEAVSHAPAAPGIYNLRVVSFAGAGEFFIDVSGALDTGPPCNTTLPPVSGTPQVGEVIHGGNGGWSGGGLIQVAGSLAQVGLLGYHHQWLRCDALGGGCSPIAGQVWRGAGWSPATRSPSRARSRARWRRTIRPRPPISATRSGCG
jgi:serine protease AprX